MNQQLNVSAFASAGAMVAAFSMLLLGVGGNIGIYEGAASMMRDVHMFFTFSFIGIIGGMIEGAIISYFFLYIFALVYNRSVARKV